MNRVFTTTALASLTLHVTILSMYPAFASNGNCTPSGAEGCSCQPYLCDINVENESCNMMSDCEEESMACYYENILREESFEVAAAANATVCKTTGPLVGAGCNHGALSYCKTIRMCVCDGFNHCQALDEEEGYFEPCTPN